VELKIQGAFAVQAQEGFLAEHWPLPAQLIGRLISFDPLGTTMGSLLGIAQQWSADDQAGDA